MLSYSPWFALALSRLARASALAPAARRSGTAPRRPARRGRGRWLALWSKVPCAAVHATHRRGGGGTAPLPPVAGSAWARCKSAGGRRGGAGLPVRGARRPVRAWPRGPRTPGATSAGGRALAAGGETAGRPRRRGRRTAGLGRQTAWGENSMMEVESGACLAGSLGGGSRSEEF